MPSVSSAADPVVAIARELSLPPAGVAAVVALLGDGATVPFIARYRKEATGSLDEVQIRAIEERREYLHDLAQRRTAVLASIAEQGKLTPELTARIHAAPTKQALEDLYLPYKQKRRTRALIARERGLQPLADRILAQPPRGNPAQEASAFVSTDKGVADVDTALAGASDIVAEQVAERAEVRALVREAYVREGQVTAKKAAPKDATPTKFDMYSSFREPVATMASHRYLAVRRGEDEGVLRVSIDVDDERLLPRLLGCVGVQRASPFAGLLSSAVEDSLKRLLGPAVENEVRGELKLRADRAAIDVFAENLRNVLLAAPLGPHGVIGIDPGLRTGCKCAAVDASGRFDGHITIFPATGSPEKAKDALLEFIQKHAPTAVGIGNGTGGRETEAFVRTALQAAGKNDVIVTSVNEAGASVYSASDIARDEHPDVDVTVRGAISIARRLQDPLAELVKVDAKAIGVGQYQHDVQQALLTKKLDDVVDSCVNHVGVDLNTASAPLLSHVSGIGPTLAKKIVKHREKHGVFGTRAVLLDVAGLGPKAFEQAAGFLRVRGAHPLDASGVHPERYALVQRMANDLAVPLATLVGSADVARIALAKYVSADVGLPTLEDIVAELKKPARDPRRAFEPPRFRDDVKELTDLAVGMELEGVVTNVTAFGAFVDIGVHQDGLVHISQLSDRFITNPHDVVKPGDRVSVRVLEVDLQRRRVALTCKRSGAQPAPSPTPRQAASTAQPRTSSETRAPATFSNNAFAELLGGRKR